MPAIHQHLNVRQPGIPPQELRSDEQAKKNGSAKIRLVSIPPGFAVACDGKDPEKHTTNQSDMKFPKAAKNTRSSNRDEEPACSPSCRDQQIKSRQVARVRLQPHQFSMADHAAGEENHAKQRYLPHDGSINRR